MAKITEEDKAKGITSIANVKLDKVVEIAKKRIDKLSAKDLKSAVKTILGTLNSMNGILVEGKKPKEVIKDINETKWNNLFES